MSVQCSGLRVQDLGSQLLLKVKDLVNVCEFFITSASADLGRSCGGTRYCEC